MVRPGRPLDLPDVGIHDVRERRSADVRGAFCESRPASIRPTCSAGRRSTSSAPARDAARSSCRSRSSRHTTSRATRSGKTGQLVRAAPRHRGRFANAACRRPRSYNEPDISDKPWFMGRWNRPLTSRRDAAIVTRMRERWESLLAVDDAVARIVGELSAHRRAGRHLRDLHVRQRLHAGRAPRAARQDASLRPVHPGPAAHPRAAAAQQTEDEGTGGQHRPGSDDPARTAGRRSRTPARRTLLPAVRPRCPPPQPASAAPRDGRQRRTRAGQHARRRCEAEQPRVPAWRAVRTTRWLYVDYKGGQRELYDLKRDPAQLRSVSRRPAAPGAPAHLAPDPRRPTRCRGPNARGGRQPRCADAR